MRYIHGLILFSIMALIMSPLAEPPEKPLSRYERDEMNYWADVKKHCLEQGWDCETVKGYMLEEEAKHLRAER